MAIPRGERKRPRSWRSNQVSGPVVVPSYQTGHPRAKDTGGRAAKKTPDPFDFTDTNSVLWQLADNLGSVRDLVDWTGEDVQHYVFDGFGNLLLGDPSKT